MYGIDPLYIIVSLPALLLGLFAQLVVWYFFSKFSRVRIERGLNGVEATRIITQNEGIDVSLGGGGIFFGDSYNPLTNTLNLSYENAVNPSITAVSVAAHELGHAEQDQKASTLFKFRTGLVPIVNLGSMLGYIIFAVGLALQIAGLAWLGIILFSGTTLFSVLTLPIEIDASRRGMRMIKENQLLNVHEVSGAKWVLIAAALTYVAATVQSLSTLLYFILRAGSIRRDD